jgi:hypothetical protein
MVQRRLQLIYPSLVSPDQREVDVRRSLQGPQAMQASNFVRSGSNSAATAGS